MPRTKSQFTPHLQALLTEKRDKLIKQLDKDQYKVVEIAWIFNLTKARISQIVTEGKSIINQEQPNEQSDPIPR